MNAGGDGWIEKYPDGARRVPERFGDGRLAGFSFRAIDGRKGSPSRSVGARRGLIVPANLHKGKALVLVVEGASDVAAARTLGLVAVGRPSNNSGADDWIDC